jgi:hypothetical protein
VSFLGSALGSIVGGLLGGSSQSSSANDAAQAQENITQQDLAYLQQAGSQQRGAINSLLPYAQGPSQAAAALRPSFLAPGQGAIFGGQQFNANANAGTPDYSSLLSPQTPASALQAPVAAGNTPVAPGASGGSPGKASPLTQVTLPNGGVLHYNASAPGSLNSALASAIASQGST